MHITHIPQGSAKIEWIIKFESKQSETSLHLGISSTIISQHERKWIKIGHAILFSLSQPPFWIYWHNNGLCIAFLISLFLNSNVSTLKENIFVKF